jgi:hypothetical protein
MLANTVSYGAKSEALYVCVIFWSKVTTPALDRTVWNAVQSIVVELELDWTSSTLDNTRGAAALWRRRWRRRRRRRREGVADGPRIASGSL